MEYDENRTSGVMWTLMVMAGATGRRTLGVEGAAVYIEEVGSAHSAWRAAADDIKNYEMSGLTDKEKERHASFKKGN